MDWPTILTMAAVNIGLIGWIRSDSKDFKKEIRSWKDEIHKETKDFHGKLASIEARWYEETRKKRGK